jgi:hypothetical protein
MDTNNVGYVGFCQIFRMMSNLDNIENEFEDITSILKTNTNTDIHINIFSGYEYG